MRPMLAVLVAFGSVTVLFGQDPTLSSNSQVRDPGLRGGTAAAGGPIGGLTSQQIAHFNEGKETFKELDSVSGTAPGEPGKGLGPSFNLNSCAGCHAFPEVGGSSPSINPQIAVALLRGAKNAIPSFIKSDGPIREARFKRNADGSPDGGVHDLFVITGRTDAPRGCNLQQTNFDAQVSRGNVVFRIPTPNFGNGLIESIPDAVILANRNANSGLKSQLGISGHENRTGNDGTITRFGWKAQNKSLQIFAGEAYHVEQGVTSEMFPNARETSPECEANSHPEDNTNFDSGISGDVTEFAMFMRLLAAPTSVSSYGKVTATSINHGSDLFGQAGCALCHTPSLTTGPTTVAGLSNQTARLYSDLLVHNMGSGLADGISQGNAGGDEFRTAPLWGLGQRIYLLHDGRTSDLLLAIRAHSSQGSEANRTIDRFNSLSDSQKQDLLNFLRSL